MQMLIEQLNDLGNMDTTIFLWSKDKKGKYLSCNRVMYNAVGLSHESDMLGLTDFDLCWEKLGHLFKRNDDIVMHERKSKVFIEPSQTITGKILNFCTHKQPLLGNRNKILGTIGLAVNQIGSVSSIPQHGLVLSTPISINEKIYLSKRYKEIANYLILGKTSKEIAKCLDLSFRTIEFYIAIIKKKFDVTTKSQLIERLLNNIA